jgi:DNA-directed RNA polymerase subunit alpha
MEQAIAEAIETVVAKDAWTADDHDELIRNLCAVKNASKNLRRILGDLEARHGDAQGAPALKIGIGRYILCRFEDALQSLRNGTDNKDRRFFTAQCYRALRRYDKAVEEFDLAEARGFEGAKLAVLRVECLCQLGRTGEAEKIFQAARKALRGTADEAYAQGLLAEAGGDTEGAVAAYNQARALDAAHGEATFRLAYCLDLHGEEDEAAELYKESLSHPPVYASALINLAVLHEDAGRYDAAISCLRRILTVNPSHSRARLFLRDAEASKTMYYDEDQARRIAKRNAVLDIPVTDFELSVRARNCLRKMNIHTLGDLVRTTEAELLGYKNFGETSLKEIKDMLAAKNLRLGQAREEGSEYADLDIEAEEEEDVSEDDGVLATPIAQVEFSVRARRVLDVLKVKTLGDLAGHSEAEMMSQKNFGQTSLNEMRQKLGEYGLAFRPTE